MESLSGCLMLTGKTFYPGFPLIFSCSQLLNAQQYSSGIGIYSGNLKEFFGPGMKIDTSHYRNLALYAKTISKWKLTTRLAIENAFAAFSVRLKITGDKSGERILPAIYSDNYSTLLPCEEQAIKMKVKEADIRGERPEVAVEGYNVR